MSGRAKPRVLVVEDDEDSREMLLAFLDAEGYEAVGTRTAEDGLEALRSGGFGMVISDHRLPGKTGVWMLQEAQSAGLLNEAGALLCSADPDPGGHDGIRVLKKPIDLDRMLLEIEAALASTHRRELERRHSLPAMPPSVRDGAAETVEVVLYVTDSLTSHRAVRNLELALAQHDPAELQVTICDLSRDPLAGVDDRVAFTPILIRRSPLPRESLLGDLRREQEVHRLLERRTKGKSS